MSDHGRFIWYELMTPDTAGAKRFYGDLVGWTAQDMPKPDDSAETYSILSADGNGVAGMMRLGEAMKGIPPNWTGYICVDDCDAAISTIKAGGGQVLMGPQDVPGDDRIVNGVDPQGAYFSVVARKA